MVFLERWQACRLLSWQTAYLVHRNFADRMLPARSVTNERVTIGIIYKSQSHGGHGNGIICIVIA
jgi:hypothetical protein